MGNIHKALDKFGDDLEANGLFFDLPFAIKHDEEIATILDYVCSSPNIYYGMNGNEIITLNYFTRFTEAVVKVRANLPKTNQVWKNVMAKQKVKDLERDFV